MLLKNAFFDLIYSPFEDDIQSNKNIKIMKYLLAISLTTVALLATAQPHYHTQAKACVTDEGVTLRWAPTDMQSWQAGLSSGYIVERFTIMKNGEILSPEDIAAQKIRTEPIKAKPLEAWEPFSDEKYVAIAAECMYGDKPDMAEAGGGFSPMMAYRRHRAQQQRFSFALYAADMSPKAAELSGLMMKDMSVSKDSKYLYKVFLAVADTIQQDTAMVFVSAGVETPMMNLQAPKVIWRDHIADLQLDLTYCGDAYTSYIFERSDNKGNSWSAISDDPTISIVPEDSHLNILNATDTLQDNNTVMQYRVYGIDCFGRKGPVSEVAEGHGAVPLTATPYIVRSEAKDNNKVEIEWFFPEEQNGSVDGFRIYRQSGPKDRLKKIMEGRDALQRTFVDNIPGMTNYYKVSAYNSETEKLMATVSYVGLVDSIPPAAPIELVGTIDTTGIATVKWKANTEADLAGYRVYMANSLVEDFALVTPSVITDTVFTTKVNLNTLSHEIYYCVRAVDKRSNHSQPSAPLVLMRPDTIPPVAPVIEGIEEKRGRAVIRWTNSSSDDVACHVIMRREAETAYDTIATIPMSEGREVFEDKKGVEGVAYIYAVYAQDKSGNCSRVVSRNYVPSSPLRDKVNFKTRRDADGVHLSWTVVSRKQIVEYVIYRAEDDGELLPYTRTDKTDCLDSQVKVGKKYRYAIRLVYANGDESELFN